jgi:sigma-B regulation protein RsbU (phosphoserine phosphatase)
MAASARLTIAADAAAAASASGWARALGAQLGLPERDLYRLDLCVTELVTNIASYGYIDRAGFIDLSAEASRVGGGIRVEIIDSGSPFNPLGVERPSARKGADVPVGGFGIALVLGFVDECSYERRGAQNVFEFTIRRREASPS